MYNAYIVKLKNVRKHLNADRLQVAEVFGNSVVVDLSYNENDLVIYFPTDGQLGVEFCEANNIVRKKDENGNSISGYLDPEKRNITALKLRGEKSDGLVLPVKSLEKFYKIETLKVGDIITILGGITICQKYVPQSNHIKNNKASSGNKNGKQTNTLKSKFPLFMEHIDTSQLAYNLNAFNVGDICQITLKLHGTSARSSYTQKETYKTNWINRLFHRKGQIIKTWDYVSGTRRTILTVNNLGFYGDNEFRQKWHRFFDGKLNKGETIFYEIVGYVSKDKPIMAQCDNKKTQDKEFIKQYGSTTTFDYGCENGENQIYVYRINLTNEDGFVVEYTPQQIKTRCEQMGCNVVPEFETFIFTNTENLMEKVNNYIEGVDTIGKKHIKEGVVVRILNKNNFAVFKHKSFNFKVLEGICKANAAVADIEEQEETVNE